MAGICSDRIGNKRILLTSFLLTSLSAIGVSLATDCYNMKYLRFLVGLGMGGINCCVYTQIKNMSSDAELGAVLSNNYLIVFGLAMLMPAIGTVIAVYFGWRYVLWIGGICTLILYLCLAMLLPRDIKSNQGDYYSYLQDVCYMVLRRDFFRCCLIATLTIGHVYGLQALAAQFQDNVYQDLNKWMLQFCGRILMCIAVFCSGYYVNQENLKYISSYGVLGIMFSALCILYSVVYESPMMFIAGFILSYGAIGISQPTMKTEILLVGHALPGIAQGMMSVCGAMWEWLTGKVILWIIWPYGVYVLVGIIIINSLYCVYATYND